MRTKIQLLLMLRNCIVAESDFWGMCACISDMLATQIDWLEYNLLKDYLQKHKPVKARIRGFLHTNIYSQYWWTMRIKEPRLHWIDRRIRIEIRKQKLKRLFKL
jgi:hypothetical protein